MHSISRALIEVANTASSLTPGRIDPSWIIEGNPQTQQTVLSKSADWRAWTMIWQCSEGKFNWYYDYDETVLILDGSAIIENGSRCAYRAGEHRRAVLAHARNYRDAEGRRCRCGETSYSRRQAGSGLTLPVLDE